MNMKVLLAGLKYDDNLGDGIIFDCTKHIVQKVVDCEIDEMDLTSKTGYKQLYPVSWTLFRKLRRYPFLKISEHNSNDFGMLCHKYSFKYSKQGIIYKQYYEDKIKDCDSIVFVGGGLIKFNFQDCYLYIDMITKWADKYNKPVLFVGAGVEGYDEKDYRCRLLKHALNRNCVKFISTRDDYDTLVNCYIENSNIQCKKVADSAVWSSSYYGIQKRESDCIGIGVVRPKIFTDHGISFSEEELIAFYGHLFNELKNRNIDFELYSNGLESDQLFAQKLASLYNIDKVAKRPTNPTELLKIESSFRAVIVCRLHACITSYSLDIPCLGIVWNQKLVMFGENIHHPERFFTIDQLDAKKIVDTLQDAMIQGYDENVRREYMESTVNVVKEYFSKY